MTLRRYTPLAPSKGTVIPGMVRANVLRRDRECVGRRLDFPVSEHLGAIELDHVRASHGIGMKSESTEGNLVALCGSCHRWKTEHGREAFEHDHRTHVAIGNGFLCPPGYVVTETRDLRRAAAPHEDSDGRR